MDDEIMAFELMEPTKPYSIRHRCYYFSKEVIEFVKECKFEKIYNSLFDQLVRCATSIGANVVEGMAGSSVKDWRNFYTIALKSANETKYWLCLIRDTMNVSKQQADNLLKEANEISKIIASIILNSK